MSKDIEQTQAEIDRIKQEIIDRGIEKQQRINRHNAWLEVDKGIVRGQKNILKTLEDRLELLKALNQ